MARKKKHTYKTSEAHRKALKKYYLKNREWLNPLSSEYNKQYYKDNKEKILAYKKEYYKQNADSIKAHKKEVRNRNKRKGAGFEIRIIVRRILK